MEGIAQDGVSALFGYGPLGVAVVALAFSLVKLFGKYEALQETRVEELKAVEGALHDNTKALESLREIIASSQRG